MTRMRFSLLVLIGLISLKTPGQAPQQSEPKTPSAPVSAAPIVSLPFDVVPDLNDQLVTPPSKLDLLKSKEGGGGNEVGGGGNEPDAHFAARGSYLVEAMLDFNRLHTDFPESLIPMQMISKFSNAVHSARVYTWEDRPLYKGQPRDAGVFKDPENGNKLSIALFRESFDAFIRNEVNYDEIVLHEYALIAELPDQFYLASAPVIAKLKYAGVVPVAPKTRQAPGAKSKIEIPRGLSNRPSTRVYFKTGGDSPPNAMGIFLGAKDSFLLNSVLGPENLVVSFPRSENGVTGVSLMEVAAEKFLKFENFMKNGFVSADDKGNPRLGISCGEVTETPSCVIWQWLRNDDMKKGTELVWLPSYEINGVKQKYLRMEIRDPADARMLYDRMRLQAEPFADDRFTPTRNFLRKGFYASDDSFSLDCMQFYGATSGYSCVIEASLLDVTTASEEQPGLISIASRTYAYHQEKAAELIGARKTVKDLVASSIQTQQNARQKLREEVMREALAGYYQNRGFSPFNGGGRQSSALLNAVDPEDLLVIAEEVRRQLVGR